MKSVWTLDFGSLKTYFSHNSLTFYGLNGRIDQQNDKKRLHKRWKLHYREIKAQICCENWSMCFQMKLMELTERMRLFLHLTDGRHHSSHEVKRAGEVPPRSDRVHTDARHVRLLVVPEEVVQVLLAQVVLLAEMLEPLRPALLRLAFLRLLQRGEDGGPAEEVDDDEQRQQQEPRVVLVYRTGAAAAAAPTCHYVAVVTAGRLHWRTCGMVLSNKTHSPRKKSLAFFFLRQKSPVQQSLFVVVQPGW